MADTLEAQLAPNAPLGQIPGLSQYLAMQQFMQKRDQQQRFLAERGGIDPNAPNATDQYTNLGLKYEQNPTNLLHYGLASQDKKAALAATLLHHNQLIDVAIERNTILRDTNTARLKDKEAQDAVMNHFREQDRKLNEQKASNDLILKQLGLNITQQRADTAQQAVEQKGSKLDEPLLNMLDKIDATKRAIENNPEAVGGRGALNRLGEFVSGTLSPGQETPASDLQSRILDLQTTYRGLPGHAASRLKIDAAKIDDAIKGLGLATNADMAQNSLTVMRESIAKQLERKGGTAPEASGATPQFPPAPMNPADRVDGVPYTTPKGVLKWDKKKGKWLSP